MQISPIIDALLSVVTLGGVAFAVYRSYRDPQTNSERTDAVMNNEISHLKADVTTILSNHLPHIDAMIKDIHNDQAAYALEISTKLTRLETIIDERIPRK